MDKRTRRSLTETALASAITVAWIAAALWIGLDMHLPRPAEVQAAGAEAVAPAQAEGPAAGQAEQAAMPADGVARIRRGEDEPMQYMRQCPLDAALQMYISGLCRYYGMDTEAERAVYAIMDLESKFDPAAVGDDGESVGLMQINMRWHTERLERLGIYSPRLLYEPGNNVRAGIDYLAELLRWADGDLDLALMAYNMGPDEAARVREETGDYSLYVHSIRGLMDKY